MKKLFCLLLVLICLPVIAFSDESDVVGCWAHYEMLTDGAPAMSMLYLAEDHTCYFVTQMFHPDKAGVGRKYVGTWSLQSDGSIYAKTGNNTDMTLTIFNESLAFDKSTMTVFVNITPFHF